MQFKIPASVVLAGSTILYKHYGGPMLYPTTPRLVINIFLG